jgi:hypothetical protein
LRYWGEGLLLERLAGIPKTTDSRHSLPEFYNLVKDKTLTGPNRRASAFTFWKE